MSSNMTPLEYKSETDPMWCNGCGDYAVLSGLLRSMSELSLDPENVVTVSGIGCSSRLPDYVKTYGFHGAHGRALPVAIGIKTANPRLTVLAVGGDGDGLSIGVGHFVHAARKNPDITYIMMNNSLYGMTKGQYSPCSFAGTKSGTSPYGSFEQEMSPISLALTLGVTFVARCSSGNISQLTQIIEEGIQHKGFSFLEVISPCVTFGEQNQYKELKQKACNLDETYRPDSRRKAMTLAMTGEKIFTGVFYRERMPTMDESLLKISERVINSGGDAVMSDSWQQFK